jgi:ketosteroid isomerase-like protein
MRRPQHNPNITDKKIEYHLALPRRCKEAGVSEEELFELEVEFMEAVKRRDISYLDGVLGENFVLTTGRPGAEVRSREEWLEVTWNRYRIESFEFEWLRVEAYGDAAVVRSRYRQSATMDDQDRSSAYLMTDVWIRREGVWQLVTRHVSPLSP